MEKILVAAAVATILLASGTSAQSFAFVSKRGTKCLAATNGRVTGAACVGNAPQLAETDFSFSRFGGVGLRLGGECLRRVGRELQVAPCSAADADEAFHIDSATLAISTAAGAKVCIDLGNEWRAGQPVSLAPCSGVPSQKWLAATLSAAAGSGRVLPNDTVVEVRSGDSIRLSNGQFLVVK